MKVLFKQLGNLQVSGGDGLTTAYTHEAGETVELPDSIALMFIEQGIAGAVQEPPAPAPAPRPRKKKGA